MGKSKRNSSIIVLSSDDEFDTKPAPKSVPNTRKNPKRLKRVSLPITHSSQQHTGFDQVKLLCEEFNQGFPQCKVSSGSENKDQWVSKYKPCSLEELAVHKKKVEEVKSWFEERLEKSKETSHNNVILISGQPGVGKSATIYAIASHLGAEVYEWNTPTPRLWQEHLHTSSSGLSYMSKLAEFESFVESIRKYGLVSSSSTSWKSVIVLIDDLPVVNEKISCERLNKCLHLLLQSVRHPTAILINDYSKSDSIEQQARYWEQLQLSLQSAGAFKVAFNPITVNSIKKVLTRIRRLELFEVSDEHIDLIAKASGGDIRHAITSLQYFSLKPHSFNYSSTQRRFLTDSEESGAKSGHLEDGISLPFGKDATLSLFHALGKFLHNKRENESLISSGKDVIRLKEKFIRCPLKMDAPEIVLSQAHGQARLVIDFLHENVLDFINEEAIEVACDVAAYLSDADFLLAQQTGTSRFDADNFIQSAAASVSVRGVLFGNTRPVSSRWHAIRRPYLWQAQQSSWQNKSHMLNQIRDMHPSMGLSKLSVIATEFSPALNWLGHRVAGKTVLDEFGSSDLVDDVIESDDDEIEDW